MDNRALSAKANKISIILIILYLLMNITGPLFLAEISIIIRRPEVYNIQARLVMCLITTLSALVPICYAVILFNLSKKHSSNIFIWSYLALLAPFLTLILFFVIFIRDKTSSGSKFENTEILIRNLVLIVVAGFIIRIIQLYLLKILIIKLLVDIDQTIYFASSQLIQIYATINIILIHICVAIWINRTTRKTDFNLKVWTLFGLFGGLVAPILLYLIDMIKKNEVKNLL